MANNRKKQQKKLNRRKKAVAKAKKESQIIKSSLAGNQNVAFAANAPIYQCFVPEDLFESGRGQTMISRKLPNGNIATGMFLLDVFCLGIKDAFGKILSQQEYVEVIEQMEQSQSLRLVEPSYFRKLVEGTEAYAKSIGFKASLGYAKTRKIFGNISIKECQEEFVFGKDGKPLYVNGPYDGQTKIQQILDTLTKTLGSDGFAFTFVPRDMFDDDEDYDEDDFDEDDFDDDDFDEDDFDDDDEDGFGFVVDNDLVTSPVIDIEAKDVTDLQDDKGSKK